MVEIKQDIHYTHDRDNQEVFTLKIKKHSEHAMSYACSYTVAELREISLTINNFLDAKIKKTSAIPKGITNAATSIITTCH